MNFNQRLFLHCVCPQESDRILRWPGEAGGGGARSATTRGFAQGGDVGD